MGRTECRKYGVKFCQRPRVPQDRESFVWKGQSSLDFENAKRKTQLLEIDSTVAITDIDKSTGVSSKKTKAAFIPQAMTRSDIRDWSTWYKYKAPLV